MLVYIFEELLEAMKESCVHSRKIFFRGPILKGLIDFDED